MARHVLKSQPLGIIFPPEVEAEVWWKNGDHPEDYARERVVIENGDITRMSGEAARSAGYEGGVVRYWQRPDVPGHGRCARCFGRMDDHGWLDCVGEGLTVCPGDFVIDVTDPLDGSVRRVPMRAPLFLALYVRT